jgi:hypothetical protein
MHAQIPCGLRHGHAPLSNQFHRLQFKLSRKRASRHAHLQVPSYTSLGVFETGSRPVFLLLLAIRSRPDSSASVWITFSEPKSISTSEQVLSIRHLITGPSSLPLYSRLNCRRVRRRRPGGPAVFYQEGIPDKIEPPQPWPRIRALPQGTSRNQCFTCNTDLPPISWTRGYATAALASNSTGA